MSSEHDDDKLGYKRPPRSTQFQPGHSGNPSGRPKARRGIDADLRDELSKLVEITEGGGTLSISNQQAIARQLVVTARKGGLRAIGILLDWLSRDRGQVEADESAASTVNSTPPEDIDILDNFAERGTETSNRAGLVPPQREAEK